MASEDRDWALLWRSVATMVGFVVLLAGSSTLLALLAFPQSAVEGGSPLAGLDPALQGLAALALLILGAGLIFLAVAGPVRSMLAARRREREDEDA